MNCKSVRGFRLPDVKGDDDLTGIWHEPPGSWRWRFNGYKGPRAIEVVLPSSYPNGPGVVHRYQIFHGRVVKGSLQRSNGNDSIWCWDGDEDLPTLYGSILVETSWGWDNKRIYWHGYMTEGDLEGCE